ncbi:Hypothetical_protein [Hexamita inflata]|uniref:Hypothetical_protein n=1 Tax=Hexamita inflata TaxID=28002 RepID=A0AA86RD06_9EUKA|nr:Hypothetical protein HINF_LOCUS58433 [Hexamita inflata]
MRPSQIVLDNSPKEDQIFEGIPLHTVISYVYSQTERQIQSYMTPKGTYLLGQYGFPAKSLFSSCKKQQTDKMIVLKPVIFIANKSKKQVITTENYTHTPFKTWLRRVDEIIFLERKEQIFSSNNNGLKKQQSFFYGQTSNNSLIHNYSQSNLQAQNNSKVVQNNNQNNNQKGNNNYSFNAFRPTIARNARSFEQINYEALLNNHFDQ